MEKLFKTNSNLLIFSLILIISALLRFNNITLDSLWLDELFSMDFSNPQRSISEVIFITLNDVHPPLYQILLWIWLKIFGFTEYTARSLSVILGIATVSSSYFLAKELYKEKIALAVSFIFSVNIFLIFFSHEVRSYQLTILLCMVSYLYFYKALVFKKKKDLYIYWIVTILWICTHYFSFFIILTQIIFTILYLILFEENKKVLLKIKLQTTILFTLTVIPFIPFIIKIAQGNKFWFIPKPSITYFLNYMHFYFGYGGLYFILIGFLFTIYHLLTKKIEKKEKIILLMLFIWLIFGYFLPYLKSILSSPLVQARYSIVMIPPIVLLSIYGISKQKSFLQIIIFICFTVFSLKVLFIDFGDKPYKHDYRGTIKYVSKHSNIPIYELIPENGHNKNNTNHFQVYSDILNLNLNILDDKKFMNDYKKKTLPSCFWTIYTFYSPTLTSLNDVLNRFKLSNNEKYTAIHKKEYKGAGATLFSRKDFQKSCLQKLNIKD